MLTYQGIKTWFEENKQNIVIGICFVLVFIIGFGAGRFNKELNGRRTENLGQNNYTTKSKTATTQTAEEGTTASPAAQKPPTQILGAATDKTCLIKGNASSKIYHMPGGAFYSTLKSPKCFATETEAQAAGYRKSGR